MSFILAKSSNCLLRRRRRKRRRRKEEGGGGRRRRGDWGERGDEKNKFPVKAYLDL